MGSVYDNRVQEHFVSSDSSLQESTVSFSYNTSYIFILLFIIPQWLYIVIAW
jgi:hypothetical protein